MSDAITIREEGYALAKPADMLALADTVRKHIDAQKLYTVIQGKRYPHVEAWQMAGAMLGLLPHVETVEDISTDGVSTYRATVRLVDGNGQTRGRGVAMCSNGERTKKSFDSYAVMSMAQTRAVGKAYRLAIGWILRTAGYEATPAEEMDGVAVSEPPKAAVPEEPQDFIMPDGKYKGKPLSEVPIDTLNKARDYYAQKGGYDALVAAIGDIIGEYYATEAGA